MVRTVVIWHGLSIAPAKHVNPVCSPAMPVDYIVDEPPRGAIGDLRPFQRRGFEGLRSIMRGDLPVAPPSRMFGSRVTDVGLGKATFSMPVTRWIEDGFGIMWAGVFALFADAPLGTALWTGLPAGKTATTSELNMSFVRPATRETSVLVGRAETIHLSRQVGLSTVSITDQNGRLLAWGSTKCLIIDVPVDPDIELPEPDTGPVDPPDPYLREPPPGDAYVTQDEIINGVPIEIQRRLVNKEYVFPIHRTTGLSVSSIDDGVGTLTLPTSPWFSNGGPSVYGGVLAWLADHAMGGAVYSTLGPGDVFGTLDLNVRFMRPALINSGDLTAHGEVTHRGRRVRMAAADIVNSEGKRVAMATSSVLLLPGGVREMAKGRLPDEIVAEIV